MMKYHFLFHFFVYYLAWFGGLFLAANHHPEIATALLSLEVLIACFWQYSVARETQGLVFFISLLALTGTLVDSVLLNLNLLVFESNHFTPYLSPPWMIGIWISFAVLFYSTLMKWGVWPYFLGVLSFIAFPLAYYSGVKIGAAYLPQGVHSLILIGFIWMFLLPFILRFYFKRMLIND